MRLLRLFAAIFVFLLLVRVLFFHQPTPCQDRLKCGSWRRVSRTPALWAHFILALEISKALRDFPVSHPRPKIDDVRFQQVFQRNGLGAERRSVEVRASKAEECASLHSKSAPPPL